MRPVTSKQAAKEKSCCASTVAQCCSKSSKVVAGCHN